MYWLIFITIGMELSKIILWKGFFPIIRSFELASQINIPFIFLRIIF